MGKLITIKQATELLGITKPTLLDWIDKGILRANKVNKFIYLDSDSVTALQDDAKDVESGKNMLRELRKEYYDEIAALREQKRTRLHWKHIRWRLLSRGIRSEFLSTMIDLLGCDGSKRDKQIFKDILYGDDVREIAERNSLTSERIRQIAYKMIRRLAKLPTMDDLQKEVRDLNDKTSVLEADYQKLLEENRRLRSDLAKEEFDGASIEEPTRLYQFLTTKVEDSELCIRLKHIFYKEETIADIVRMTPREALGMRNMGRKAYNLLEEEVKSYGVELGFDVDGFIRWYLRKRLSNN